MITINLNITKTLNTIFTDDKEMQILVHTRPLSDLGSQVVAWPMVNPSLNQRAVLLTVVYIFIDPPPPIPLPVVVMGEFRRRGLLGNYPALELN